MYVCMYVNQRMSNHFRTITLNAINILSKNIRIFWPVLSCRLRYRRALFHSNNCHKISISITINWWNTQKPHTFVFRFFPYARRHTHTHTRIQQGRSKRTSSHWVMYMFYYSLLYGPAYCTNPLSMHACTCALARARVYHFVPIV